MRPSPLLGAGALLMAVAAAGCATKAVPSAQLDRSSNAIRVAETEGASDVPIAREHLRLAQSQLADARALIDDGKYERAHFVLIRAEADASAAASISHAARAKVEAEKTLDAVRAEKERAREGAEGKKPQS